MLSDLQQPQVAKLFKNFLNLRNYNKMCQGGDFTKNDGTGGIRAGFFSSKGLCLQSLDYTMDGINCIL